MVKSNLLRFDTISIIVLQLFIVGYVIGDPTIHMDFFHAADKNNDTSLSMDECKSMWGTLDVDKDTAIDKVEFLIQWTFHNFQDASHAPLFFRLVDNDFDGRISASEISQLCSFFDDDEDRRISTFEFDMNWKGLFTKT